MFICPEIDHTGSGTKKLFNLYVLAKRADTNTNTLSTVDGVWSLHHTGLSSQDDPKLELQELRYFYKTISIMNGITIPDSKMTIAEFSTHTGIDINTNFTDTNDFYWGVRDGFRLRSDFWFTVYTPDGLSFIAPTATGINRGLVYERDIIFRKDNNLSVNYEGELEADYTVSVKGEIIPETIDNTYKAMVVKKEKAKNNPIVFTSVEICNPGDYIDSWDGIRYVILQGIKIEGSADVMGSAEYEYIAVEEQTDTYTFSSGDIDFPPTSLKSAYWSGVAMRVYRNAAHTVTGSATTIVYDTIQYDTAGAYSTATGRFTAPVDGYYRVHAMVTINLQNDGRNLGIHIYKNGSQFSTFEHAASGIYSRSNWYNRTQITDIVYLAAGDYIDIRANTWDANVNLLGTYNTNFFDVNLTYRV